MPADLERLGELAREVYVEAPLDHELEALLDELEARGLGAKVRCGGASVPNEAALGSFVRLCGERAIPFKATAGLHHAIRRERRARLPEPPRGSRVRRGGGRARRGRSGGVLARLRQLLVGRATRVRCPSSRRPGASGCARSGAAASSSPSRSSSSWGCCRCEGRRRVRRVLGRGRAAPRGASASARAFSTSRRAGWGPPSRLPRLNEFLALGRRTWEDVIGRAAELVEAGADLLPLEDVTPQLPFEVADYVDFYSSLEHATNLGRMFRPDAEPLLPNWRHLPVGYHGRAGTVVVSGTPVVRPCGQVKGPEDDVPRFGPSRRLDIELELGFVVGVGSTLGEPVPASAFRDHVFGVVLVNDWSARDIQAWEYQPLGPFLGKSFATSISAWVTPLALLEDRFVPPPVQDPEPLAVPRRRGRLRRSTPSSRSRSRARSSRGRTREASTGRCRSSSRTRPSTARRCAPATSSRPGRSPAPSTAARARSSS